MRHLLLIAGTALVASPVLSQTIEKELEPYKKTVTLQPNDLSRMAEFRDGKYLLTTPTPADLAVLERYAQYLIYRVTLPEFHAIPTTPLKPRPVDKTMDIIIRDLRNYLVTPDTLKRQPNVKEKPYIREFGAALDKAINSILTDRNPPPILRIATMRLFVICCESGAAAHWTTAEKILKNNAANADDYWYALKALENLIRVYDPNESIVLAAKPSDAEQRLVAIAGLMDEIVTKGPPMINRVYIREGSASLSTIKKGTDSALSQEQINVWQYYRLQAIRNLSQFHTDVIGGNAINNRHVFTLAKITLADPSLKCPPTTKEMVEALAGLASIQPKKLINIDELNLVIASGTLKLLSQRGVGEDNSLAWKGMAARIQANFAVYRDTVQKGVFANAAQKKSTNDLGRVLDDSIFNPLQGKSGSLSPQALTQWISANPGTQKGELYNDVKGFVITVKK